MHTARQLGAIVMTVLVVLSTVAPIVGLVGVASAGSAGPTAGTTSTWSAYQAGPQHTGSLPAASGVTGDNVGIAWTTGFDGTERVARWGAPVVWNETVVAVTGTKVYGINDSSGVMEWVFDPGTYVPDSRSPTIGDGRVYVVADSDTTVSGTAVMAIDATTGSSVWNVTEQDLGFPPTPAGFKTVTSVNGTVYATTSNYVVAINGTTGTVVWEHEATPGQQVLVNEGPVTVDNGTVYFGAVGDRTHLYGVNVTTGVADWTTNLTATTTYRDPVTPLVAANGNLYYAAEADSGGTRLFAVDVDTQTTTLNQSLPNTLKSEALAVTNDHVYLSVKQSLAYGDELVAFDATTGAVQWTYAYHSGSGSDQSDYENAPPVVVGSDVYVATQPNGLNVDRWNLTAVDAASGTHNWTATFSLADGERVDSPLAYDDGRLFVAGTELHAITDLGASAGTPEVDVSPTSYDFGTVDVSTYNQTTVAITNVGSHDLALADSTLSGADADQFLVVVDPADSMSVLTPGQTGYATVYFNPTTGGAKTATLDVATNDTDEPTVSVTLTGAGSGGEPNAIVTPAAVDFGDVQVDETVTTNVTVTNAGTANLTVTGATVTPGEFAVTAGNAPVDVTPGSSHNLTVAFAPTATGVVSGSLTVSSDDPDATTKTVALTATGIPEPAPAYAVDRDSHVFEAVPVDDTDQTSFIVSNPGTAPLNVTDITVTGPNASAFTLTSAPTALVPPDSDALVSVTFAPDLVGSYDATLELTHNDTGVSPATIALDGTAVDRTPPTVTIGDVVGAAEDGSTVYANDTVTVNMSATDQHGTVQSVTAQLVSTVTNYQHSVDATYNATTGNWTATIDLVNVVDDGRYEVSAMAIDDSANPNVTTPSTPTVLVDRAAPTLAATLTRVNATYARVNVTAAESIQDATLTVAVEPPTGSSMSVPVTNQSTHWAGTFQLAGDGQYGVNVTALDHAGNRGNSTARTAFANRSTDANNTLTVKLDPSDTFVRFTTDEQVNDTFVTVTQSRTPLAPLTAGNAGVNFLNAALGDQLTANLSHARIGIPVDQSELPPRVDVSDVSIRYFNESTHTWSDVPTAVETVTLQDGTTGQYWVANVTHFSTYGAVATDTHAPTITGTTPTTQHEYDAGTTTVDLRVEYADALSGVDASNVSVTFDGVDVTTAARASVTSASTSFTATGLVNDSSHTFSVTVADDASNDVTETIAFTIAAQPTTDPDPPADSDEPTARPAKTVVDVVRTTDGVTVAVTNAVADTPVTVPLPRSGIPAATVTSMNVTLSAPRDFTLDVSHSESPPPGVSFGDGDRGTPIGYLTVDHSVPDTAIDRVAFTFRVAKDRLADAGVAPDAVVLYRVHDGTVTALETTRVGENATQYAYRATSPGLSVFVMSMHTADQTTATETGTLAPTDTPAGTTTATADTTSESPGASGKSAFPLPLVMAVALLVVLGAAHMVLRRR